MLALQGDADKARRPEAISHTSVLVAVMSSSTNNGHACWSGSSSPAAVPGGDEVLRPPRPNRGAGEFSLAITWPVRADPICHLSSLQCSSQRIGWKFSRSMLVLSFSNFFTETISLHIFAGSIFPQIDVLLGYLADGRKHIRFHSA
jgi:hypothetical protein